MTIIVGNGKGRHKAEQSKENKAMIREWFEHNPGKTKKECAIALGLHPDTVRRHVIEILNEG